MKTEIVLTPEAEEPRAVIYTASVTEQVRRAEALLLAEGSGGPLTVTDQGKLFVLEAAKVYLVRVENEKTAVYDGSRRYLCSKRLYEVENQLHTAGLSPGFLRVSKACLVNLGCLDYVEPTWGGLLELTLKNGCKECISRKYLPGFKAYLGL
ncbi:MAG: LytTR family transcriptional regulator [Firmicutes bacterium]|nr:LytTR family transcriptional regulator [Bacillota bacterium]